ncbi:MAG TPA: sugar transferase [Lacibacter sp.]|nr:sugar transferase [Lacibacter sp.]
MQQYSFANRLYRNFGKRLLDITASLGALLVFSPVLLLVILLQLYFHKGRVWFRQQRPGYKGRLFYILKFKTMSDTTDENGQLLPDVRRLTPWGSFLRKTSLDELPQLINILKGEMSLVGPRPLLTEYLERYNERQKRRHDVRPGVTGWAQVNGRNAIAWEQKFELDVWYTEHVSLWLDIRILLRTVRKLFRTQEISHTGHATMPVFKGNHYADEQS